MEKPQFWWYLPGKMVIFMGYVSFREGKFHGLKHAFGVCPLDGTLPVGSSCSPHRCTSPVQIWWTADVPKYQIGGWKHWGNGRISSVESLRMVWFSDSTETLIPMQVLHLIDHYLFCNVILASSHSHCCLTLGSHLFHLSRLSLAWSRYSLLSWKWKTTLLYLQGSNLPFHDCWRKGIELTITVTTVTAICCILVEGLPNMTQTKNGRFLPDEMKSPISSWKKNSSWFKVTFWSPSWRSLNFSKRSRITIPKRAPAELPG